MAWERTKLSPRHTARLDLTAMVRAAGAETSDAVVDHFARRFLSVPLPAKERSVLAKFLSDRMGSSRVQPGEKLEESLRELLYLVLSTPEYQVG